MYIAVDKTRFNLALSTEHHGGSTHHRKRAPPERHTEQHGAPHRQTVHDVLFCPRRRQKAHNIVAKMRLKLWWANMMPTPVGEKTRILSPRYSLQKPSLFNIILNIHTILALIYK